MNMKKGLLAAICVGLLLTFGQAIAAEGEQCIVVRVEGPAQPAAEFTLMPENITVAPGTCVIWLNRSRAAEVMINFKDGLKCKDATEGGMGFRIRNVRSENCFVTDFLAYGHTSSLIFSTEGEYEYEVQSEGKGELKGKVTVKK